MATFKATPQIKCSHPHFRPPSSSHKYSILVAIPTPSTSSTLRLSRTIRKPVSSISATMATGAVQEVLPLTLTSASDPPPLFDGKTRLYLAYICPYAQRVWITRNCKGLQEKIELVPLDLQDRPAWYKDKVLPSNKVPALEHSNKIIAESLDLIKYIDEHFEGPSLLPDDPAKKEYAEELLAYTDSFNRTIFMSFKSGDISEAVSALDHIENALSKFEDGPFFLGQFSQVDIAYAPFIERFQPFLLEVTKYDITDGRPNLKAWIEEINKIDGYKPTKSDPKEIIASIKKRFSLPN